MLPGASADTPSTRTASPDGSKPVTLAQLVRFTPPNPLFIIVSLLLANQWFIGTFTQARH